MNKYVIYSPHVVPKLHEFLLLYTKEDF